MTNSIRSRRKLAAAYRLVKEPSVAYQELPTPAPIRYPRDVFQLMDPLVRVEQTEVMWLIPLNTQRQTRGAVIISRGTLNMSLVSPREVFLRAMVANANSLILVHNHPSGDPTPSPDDIQVTNIMIQAGTLLDIPVIDHVVMGEGRYISFVEAGLL